LVQRLVRSGVHGDANVAAVQEPGLNVAGPRSGSVKRTAALDRERAGRHLRVAHEWLTRDRESRFLRVTVNGAEALADHARQLGSRASPTTIKDRLRGDVLFLDRQRGHRVPPRRSVM